MTERPAKRYNLGDFFIALQRIVVALLVVSWLKPEVKFFTDPRSPRACISVGLGTNIQDSSSTHRAWRPWLVSYAQSHVNRNWA
jgi:hypothetical protein